MRVFISWSGDRSKMVAESMRRWIGLVLQQAEPWMSGSDIVAGVRWSVDIAKELEESAVAVICLTSDNTSAPWVLYEVGALSHRLGNSLVIPYLFGIEPADIAGPLAMFQATTADRAGTLRLLSSINQKLGPLAVSESTLRETFDHMWPRLDRALDEVRAIAPSRHIERSQQDVVSEILSLVRRLPPMEAEYRSLLKTVTASGPVGAPSAVEGDT